MKCPTCKTKMQTISVKHRPRFTWRRKQCKSCNVHHTTYERIPKHNRELDEYKRIIGMLRPREKVALIKLFDAFSPWNRDDSINTIACRKLELMELIQRRDRNIATTLLGREIAMTIKIERLI